MLLNGKNVVITGCLRGIGREMLEVAVDHGANVWACAIVQDPDFDAVCARLSENSGRWIKPVYFDLSDSAATKNGLQAIHAEKQPVDCLINVAGISRDALVHMTGREQLDLVFEVNLFSQILITQYITKLMVRQKRGTVVNVASIVGIDGSAGQLAYGASKAALIGVTKTLSRELGVHGIRVNAVAPGVIETEMTQNVPPELLAKRIGKTSLGRIGRPREVAETIAFLASDLASYMTGQVLRIDGGMK